MIRCSRHGVDHQAFEPCPQCIAEIQADPVGMQARFDAMESGELLREPDLSDPANVMSHRAMMAVQRAFREEFAGWTLRVPGGEASS